MFYLTVFRSKVLWMSLLVSLFAACAGGDASKSSEGDLGRWPDGSPRSKLEMSNQGPLIETPKEGLSDTPYPILIPPSFMAEARDLDFVVKKDVLAMNIPYAPIQRVRGIIEQETGLKLDFLRAWAPEGEAHITVITPIEYAQVLVGPDVKAPLISMQEIAEIAKAESIQSSEVTVLGVGSGRLKIEAREETTFFLIVESENLRTIRQQIYHLFVKKGGDPHAWDPRHFFPHITVGFTRRDLHESDGVVKDVQHSWDPRFKVIAE